VSASLPTHRHTEGGLDLSDPTLLTPRQSTL